MEPANADAPELLIGRVVHERYRVDAILGQGVVGTVYRATDTKRQRPLALKVWHKTAEDEQTRGRFEREAKALNQLRHPNIVTVVGYGLVDKRPFLAMELLSGRPLERLLQPDEPLPEAEAFHIAHQLLEALAFAHEHNIVHRDLKPENIFVVSQYDGSRLVKLLDYGLAKFVGEPSQGKDLTLQGVVMGTPLYMPPEQIRGRAIDVRADVYSAGSVLFEVFGGRPPFMYESHVGVLTAHLSEPVPALNQVLQGRQARPELQAFIETSMAKEPGERYANAGEMLRAFEALPRPLVVSTAPSRDASAESKAQARGSLLPWILGAIGIIVVVGWLAC